MTLFEGDPIWSVLKVYLCDFIQIQNLSKTPSKFLSKHKSEDELGFQFVFQGSYESLAIPNGKTRQGPFFYDSIF